jgi:DNA (cytosine-5)-methyltransferase 1
MFLIESSYTLLGEFRNKILDILKSLNYEIYHQDLDAQYYMVPQQREHLFFVGTRKDLNLNFVFPQPLKTKVTLRNAIYGLRSSRGLKYTKEKQKLFELIPPGGNWRDLPEEKQKQYMQKAFYSPGGKTGYLRKLKWSEPCLRLTPNPSQRMTERCHPDFNRPLTIREYAAVQTFPNHWVYKGSRTSCYKQIGNATPTNLASHVAKEMRKALNCQFKS